MGKIVKYTAAGGVVCNTDGTEILLLVRPSRDEVRLPKGHVEDGESSEETALRETAEEAGYDDLEILSDLGEQLVVFRWKGKQVQRTEYYFLMRALSKQKAERPETDRKQFFPVWTPWDEAMTELTFEAEKEWVRRAQKALEAL